MTGIDATQWTGCAAFGFAALSCAASRAPPYPAAAILNGLFALECLLGWRHHLHSAAANAMGSHYSGRMPLQIVLIMLAILGGLFLLRQMKCPERRVSIARARIRGAGTFTVITLLLFLVETISLHSVDGILYHSAGGLLVIGWLWIFLGGMTVFSSAGRLRS